MTKLFQISFFISLIAIEYLATTTRTIEVIENTWDKTNHLFAFFTLYILLSLAYKQFSLKQKTLLLLFFALQIEIVQYFIPNRHFSILDIVADILGIIIGIIAFKLMYPYLSKLMENR